MSASVYISSDVAEIRALHPYVSDASFRALTVRDQIALQAETLKVAHAAGDRRVRMQLESWWPAAAGHALDHIMAMPLTEADARLTIAREYGYADWDTVQRDGAATVNARFEHALDLLLTGDLAGLEEQLVQAPDLARARTAYGHRSTLLHYLGANGVESHRQVTPLNAADLATALIRHGADVNAVADMYGGGQTAYELARTSAHPHEAGVIDALLRALSPE